jgi:hypothetical protein
MPSFLQTAFAAGLAALAVPVLIHLFFRLRTKRVELGTIRFLKIVLEENARRRKVMRWFLLALRLACILLLVGLFARPYLSEAAPGADKELVVLLIDQSATMHVKGEGGRPLEQAIAEARKVLATAGEGSRIEAALFDHAVHPLKPAESDKSGTSSIEQQLQQALAQSNQYGATSYGAAMSWARDVLVGAPSGPKQLHLFTDLQRSGLDWLEVEPIPPGIKVHLHNYSRSVVNNIAVTEVRPSRTWVRPGEGATVAVTVSHGGAFALEDAPIVLEIGRVATPLTTDAKTPPARTDFSRLAGRITQRERVKLEPGASVTVSFEVPPLAEGEWQGRVFIEYDDDLPFDNQRYFAISSAPAYRVLVATSDEDDSALAGETHFLEAALRLALPDQTYDQSPFAPQLVTLSKGGSLPSLAEFSVVILANTGELSSADAIAIENHLKGGGGLIVFTGDKTTRQSLAALAELGISIADLGQTQVTRDLPWRISKWDRLNPIFLPFNDPQYGDLRRLMFAAYTKATPAKGAQILAEFDTGDPLLISQQVGPGSIFLVTTSCGRNWSDWARSSLYLPFVHQLLGDQIGLTAGGRVRSTLIDSEKPRETEGLEDDAPEQLAPTKESPKEKANEEAQNQSIPGTILRRGYTQVVNTAPRESETESSAPKDFEDRFGLTFIDEQSGAPSREVQTADDVHKDELWHWVACALLGIVLLEGFVGNRTTA